MSEPAGVIPQTDPGAAYRAQQAELDAALARVMAGGWYILGQEVAAFEREFAAYLGVAHAVGVASGTDALELALRACGIGPGDAVLTVSHTAVATVAAIERCGATPALVDIDPQRYTMDPAALRQTLHGWNDRGPRPRALIPVHLYGQPADMEAIVPIAREHGLRIIEDCAQAHGARLHGRTAGTLGDAAAFSFYPTKNLGAFGDGGMVVTADAALAAKLRSLREYGWEQRYISTLPGGMNSRLDELHAALLRVRLARLEADNRRRRKIAAEYGAALASSGLTLPAVAAGVTHVYHQYVLRTPRRDALREHLRQRGVGTGVHYPLPVHLQPAYEGRLARRGDLPHSEQAAAEVLSLPMFPQLGDEQVQRVIEPILQWTPAGVPRG